MKICRLPSSAVNFRLSANLNRAGQIFPPNRRGTLLPACKSTIGGLLKPLPVNDGAPVGANKTLWFQEIQCDRHAQPLHPEHYCKEFVR